MSLITNTLWYTTNDSETRTIRVSCVSHNNKWNVFINCIAFEIILGVGSFSILDTLYTHRDRVTRLSLSIVHPLWRLQLFAANSASRCPRFHFKQKSRKTSLAQLRLFRGTTYIVSKYQVVSFICIRHRPCRVNFTFSIVFSIDC